MNTMRAMGIEEYGAAEVLKLLQMPVPQPDVAQVRVRVIASGVNPADIALRKGTFRWFIRLKFPFIPGLEIAGIVDMVGAGVTQFKPGDAVYAMVPMNKAGGYAEYVCVEQADLAPMPRNLTWSEAAGVPLAALTALQSLQQQADLRQGERVLIYGASGGVGTFAVQIAKALGAHVTGVCSTKNLELVQDLGADEVLDYTTSAWSTSVTQYDLVLDAAAQLPFLQGLKRTKQGGRLISLNPGMNNPISKTLASMRGRQLKALLVEPSAVGLQTLTTWIEQGAIKPVIAQTYPLAEAISAHRQSETKRTRGKLILHVDEQLAHSKAELATMVVV